MRLISMPRPISSMPNELFEESPLKGKGAAMMADLSDSQSAREAEVRFSCREQALEVSVFLFLIVPSMLFSFLAIKQGTVGFSLTAVSTIARDLALLALILFFAWRNREPLRRLGWTFAHGWRDILLGIGLFVPFFYGAAFLESLLIRAGFTVPSTPMPTFLTIVDAAQILLATLLVMVVAVAEETIFRGYLMLRFKGITGSSAVAVILSAFIFSLGHGYEGSAGVITVGVMGAVFALVYLWRKSLVAPMTMHFVQDFVAIVVVALLGGR
jgi:membrane protease YdiL (CAAX protease family)